MCQSPSNGKIPNQQDLVLKHQTLCLTQILLRVPATGLRSITDLVPFVYVTEWSMYQKGEHRMGMRFRQDSQHWE